MKFSEAWLREWVNPSVNTTELADQLSMAGLEVDSVEPVAGEFEGVVVGEVLTREQHPDADKLSLCTVNVGAAETLQIVCGAPNVSVGGKYPLAPVGALVYNGKEIQVRDGQPGPNRKKLQTALQNIQYGLEPDTHGWLTEVG